MAASSLMDRAARYYGVGLGLGLLIGQLGPRRVTLPRTILLAAAIVFLLLTLSLWHMDPSLPRLKWALAGAIIMGTGYGCACWFSARRR
ncbi:MAG: hypothetical protein KA180_13435 [Gemmatimonadales bacterium]|nr:hypothetical protein [Gemmatimonadales bacterium]MBP9202159.1 hypothetical protein [Gemmatimonadales bacterium]